MQKTGKYRGFTLIEMLVVVTIIGILIGLLIPGIQYARNSARLTQCTHNQKQIVAALLSYDLAKKHLPGVVNRADPRNFSSPQTTWVTSILAELDRPDLMEVYRGGMQSYNVDPKQCLPPLVQVDMLVCPSNKQMAVPGGLSYVVNMGVYQRQTGDPNKWDFTVRLFRNRASSVGGTPSPETDFTLGTLRNPARVVMLSENLSAGPWVVNGTGKPPTIVPNAPGFFDPKFKQWAFSWPDQTSAGTIGQFLSSNHTGQIVVSFCDNHTETLPDTTKCWGDDQHPIFGVP